MEEDRITLNEFINDLQKEIKEHPEWGEMPLEFFTSDRNGMHYLSIYDINFDDGTSHVCIDIGDESD